MDTISGTFLNAARDNLASDVTATGGKMTLILKSLSDFRTRWTGAATKQRLKLLSRRTNQRLQRHLALTLKRRKTAQAASFGCGRNLLLSSVRRKEETRALSMSTASRTMSGPRETAAGH